MQRSSRTILSPLPNSRQWSPRISLQKTYIRRNHNVKPVRNEDEAQNPEQGRPTPEPSDYPSASAKLFADAAREEAEAARSKPSVTRLAALLEQQQHQYENWTGDESIQDAVLRMLVDKYKPLRSGTIMTADQRIRQSPPRVTSYETADGLILTTTSTSANVSAMPTSSSTPAGWIKTEPSLTGSWATEPLLPSIENHKPWQTEFKAPSHTASSIKQAEITPAPPLTSRRRSPLSSPDSLDDKARRQEREAKKKSDHADRLTRAKESTLDYRLGIRGSASARPAGGAPNPVNLKGWNSLIEDKIDRARKAGLFKTVKGRGQPIVRSTDESNPFIPREEFLMNRIVQRNGAAPPWVEVQGELDQALESFRRVLRQSWTRRVVRVLTMSNPMVLLSKYTLADIKAFRDPDWVKREESYHATALDEVNSLVRKYNAVAPYAVRRPYYMRHVEVEKLYEECAEEIMEELQKRMKDGGMSPYASSASEGEEGAGASPGSGIGGDWKVGSLFRELLQSLLSKMRLRNVW